MVNLEAMQLCTNSTHEAEVKLPTNEHEITTSEPWTALEKWAILQ
jgi:hypothetical protein